MNVLLLTPHPNLLVPAIRSTGDDYDVSMEEPANWPSGTEYIVSLGYRHIIGAATLAELDAVNIHVSLLPWNRGAHPNFWSWFDKTPKGVSIHRITEDLDGGPVLKQLRIEHPFTEETLRSSYNMLLLYASSLFTLSWREIRSGSLVPYQPIGAGSFHKKAELEPWFSKLSAGWDSPVAEAESLGEQHEKEQIRGALQSRHGQ